MSKDYMVFTRKWRPQNFDEILGQDQVVIPLKRAIETERVMQAYLFSGPRGVGKTTIARVLAKAVNCVEGPTVNPCNKCDICTEITNGSSLDVIEIDGASNRGIERIRELREQVGFAAAKGRKKIYIIDEVHMLTTEAFNALLKTLEEPPRHVIFVFATTDPQNIPQTILSRCQHFRFKRASVQKVIENLKEIAVKEGLDCEEEALYSIAKAADGAFRDGQRIFDQAVTYAKEGKLTSADVTEMLGEIGTDRIYGLIESITSRDLKGAIETVENIFDAGFDLKQFIRDLMESLRNILILKSAEGKKFITAGDEEFKYMEQLSETATKQEFLYVLQKTIDVEQRITKSHIPNIIIETFLADVILALSGESEEIMVKPAKKIVVETKPQTSNPKQDEKKIDQTEKVEKENSNNDDTYEDDYTDYIPDAIDEEPTSTPGLLIADIEEEEDIKELTKEIIEKRWENILTRAKKLEDGDDVYAVIETAGIVKYEDMALFIVGENNFMTDRMRKHSEKIKELLKDEFKKDIKLLIFEKNEYRKKYQLQKEVTQEEALNHPVIKDLGKVFKIESVEVKKANKDKQ